MDSSNALSNEELESIDQWTLDQWRLNLPKLSPEQIAQILPSAVSNQDPTSWKAKIHLFLEILNTPQQLEAVGRAVSFEQICEILSWVDGHKDFNLSKLFPLFVGLPHELFVLLLVYASSQQQNYLKHESVSEPIQHHLTLLTHTLSSAVDNLNLSFNNLKRQLETLDLVKIGPTQITEQEDAIEALRKTCFHTQFLTGKALAIAWNTTRTDLIEKLSSIKEHTQKLMSSQVIGNPGIADTHSSGLYENLENRLNTIFIDDDNQPLSDDEPALEALIRFSIWYISDYWEVGLLPNVANIEELELNINNSSEDERIQYRKNLLTNVEDNLKKLGLLTLHDLKQNKIYSKQALKTFIADHFK